MADKTVKIFADINGEKTHVGWASPEVNGGRSVKIDDQYKGKVENLSFEDTPEELPGPAEEPEKVVTDSVLPSAPEAIIGEKTKQEAAPDAEPIEAVPAPKQEQQYNTRKKNRNRR